MGLILSHYYGRLHARDAHTQDKRKRSHIDLGQAAKGRALTHMKASIEVKKRDAYISQGINRIRADCCCCTTPGFFSFLLPNK